MGLKVLEFKSARNFHALASPETEVGSFNAHVFKYIFLERRCFHMEVDELARFDSSNSVSMRNYSCFVSNTKRVLTSNATGGLFSSPSFIWKRKIKRIKNNTSLKRESFEGIFFRHRASANISKGLAAAEYGETQSRL